MGEFQRSQRVTVCNATRKRGADATPTSSRSRTRRSQTSALRKTSKAALEATSARADSLKRCTSCGGEKPTKEFLPTPFSTDGLIDACKSCVYAGAERDRRDREQRRREAEAKKAARAPTPTGVVTKACRSCGVAKPLDQYSRHGKSKDGHRHVCKPCDAAARAKRRATISINDLAAAHAKHLSDNHRAVKRWQAANNAAVCAKQAVAAALKRGTIAKPTRCQAQRCKSGGRLEAHHFDYANPLCVAWLCRKHHNQLHKGEKIQLAIGLPPALAKAPEKATTP